MKQEYLEKYHETKDTAYLLLAMVMDKPQDQAEAALKRLLAYTVHPERRPLYEEALGKLQKGN